MGQIGGDASGDFRLSSSALRILYSVIKDSIPVLAADGFTQSNPNVVTTTSAVSTTLPSTTKKGVLSGSVAFIRPDTAATNTVGGAVLVAAAYVAGTRPLGLFINDAVGNAFENTPAVASGKAPFLRGGAVGVKIYETAVQTTNHFATGTWATTGSTVGTAVTFHAGDFLYASVNGLLTNQWTDSYEASWIATGNLGSGTGGAPIECDVTRLGRVLSPPDSTSTEMFVELAFV